jgi:ribosome-associated protein
MTRAPHIDPREVQVSAIRAQGPGGQHVNKTSSAVHLRFDVRASSLPEPVKARLLASGDTRLTADGVWVVKAQTHRSQDRNRADALARLQSWVNAYAQEPLMRRATRPTWGSQQRRLQGKAQRSAVKTNRGRVAV